MINNHSPSELKELLKKRLFSGIATQIDLIGYVPQDINRLIGKADLTQPSQRSSNGEDPLQSVEAPRPEPEHDSEKPLTEDIRRAYDDAFYKQDELMVKLSGKTDYRNLGYWDEKTTTVHEACAKLQDKLLDLIPDKSGRILDVACGLGASTRRLLDDYKPEDVWAINISEKQIETTKKNAPGCNAQVMDAVDLKFGNDFFNNIICIEAAFHFETRRTFFDESFRVLKEGGNLVLYDILFTAKERLEQFPQLYPSPQNHIQTVNEYEQLLKSAGFRDVMVTDVTDSVWWGQFISAIKRNHRAFYEGDLNIIQLTDMLWAYYNLNATIGLCIFARATK